MSALFWFSMGVLATLGVQIAAFGLLAWLRPAPDIFGVYSDDGDGS